VIAQQAGTRPSRTHPALRSASLRFASQDYFADGITENLTTELSRIHNSFVIARNTAFTYKGKSIDSKEIGKEFGLRYVLEGSVQRDQNRVRVTYSNLAAAYAQAGKMNEGKAALAEARSRNPELTVKWVKEHGPDLPALFDGLRRAGLPEE
jgi:hypothetical protein